LRTGFFRGHESPTDTIFAAGWGIREDKMLTVYDPVADSAVHNGLKLLDGIFPSVPSSPVFPSGTIGLSQKGSALFTKMAATTLLYGSEITGWDPVSVVLARLGLSKELSADLSLFPGRWQIYCNGWGHWGLEGEVNKDAGWFFRTNMVKDVNSTAKDEKFPLPMWPFRHMSMESMSVLATAMNESLLQSYDGVLRVFPAYPSDRNGRFTLHAEGGFVVSSEIKSGLVQWICIKSLLGNTCNLDLPWANGVVLSGSKKSGQKISRVGPEIKTKVNQVIMILPEGSNLEDWSVLGENPSANDKVKKHISGKAQLGIERMF
jgi:alpha-L-fucosidase 2